MCQNIAIPSETNYGLSFTYGKSGTINPHINVTFDGFDIFEATVSSTGFLVENTGGPLFVGTIQMCFENNVANSILYIDDIVLDMVSYPEVVTYQMHVDPKTINAILIDIVFQDFFQEKYWVGGSLLGRIVLQIDGVEISSDQISQAENNAERIQLRVLLTQPISSESIVLLSINENAFTLNSTETVTFTCSRSGEVPLVVIQSEEEI